jgi:Arc/MetJ-type ribon-helix-helix transcriptional regulator
MMEVTFPRKQQEWLEAQVRAGAYDSIDGAISSIVVARMRLELLEQVSEARSAVRLKH